MPALLFDLDGTLIHSDPIHIKIFHDMYAERGRPFNEDIYMSHIHGTHNLTSFPKLFPGEDPQKLSDEKEAEFRRRLEGGQPPMPGVPALLNWAQKHGWKTAVVTNAPRVNAEHMLKAIGLLNAFDLLVIGDECEKAKPHPTPYLTAMSALNVDAQSCLAFEDSPTGVQAATDAGLFTVGITSSLSSDVLMKAGANVCVPDFTDTTLHTLLTRKEKTSHGFV